MDTGFLKNSWDQLKGRAKSEWGKLTEDDVTRANGDMEELVSIIKQRYGYQESEARKKVDDWLAKAEEKIRSLDSDK